MRPKMKKNHKKDRAYSADFKENAIQLALRSPSIEVVARELGIPKPTLYTWVINFKKGQVPMRQAKSGQPTLESLQSNVVNLMEENRPSTLNKIDPLILKKEIHARSH